MEGKARGTPQKLLPFSTSILSTWEARMSTRPLFLLVALLGAVACSSSGPADPNPPPAPPPPPPPPVNGVSGTVNGVPFTATASDMSYSTASRDYNLAASSGTTGVGLYLAGITQPGNYPLTTTPFRVGFIYPPAGAMLTTLDAPGGGNGQVTITVATPSRLAGSATYTAYGNGATAGQTMTATFSFDLPVDEVLAVRGDGRGEGSGRTLLEQQRARAVQRP